MIGPHACSPPTAQRDGFSPGIRGKVILDSPAIPHTVDGVGGVRTVMTVFPLDFLLEVSYRVKSQRSRVRGHIVTLSD